MEVFQRRYEDIPQGDEARRPKVKATYSKQFPPEGISQTPYLLTDRNGLDNGEGLSDPLNPDSLTNGNSLVKKLPVEEIAKRFPPSGKSL